MPKRRELLIILILAVLVLIGGILAYNWWGIPRGKLEIERIEFKYERGTLFSKLVSNVTLDKDNLVFETASEGDSLGLRPNSEYSCSQTPKVVEEIFDEVSRMIQSAKPLLNPPVQYTPVYSAKVILQSGKTLTIISQGPIFINDRAVTTEIDVLLERLTELTQECMEQKKLQ